ncbi:MAG: SIS domain-containing protein [Fimbriimonadaceae bacterium]
MTQLGTWMEQEVRSQPDVLAPRLDRFGERLGEMLNGREFDAVLLAARGSSDHAALYARYLIEVFVGIPAVLAAPSVWTRYGGKVRYANCLCVGISQSGAAPDVSEVLDAMGSQGHATLAITNNPGSRVGRSASMILDLDVGKESAVAATKTYSASLVAAYQLARVLAANAGCAIASPAPSEASFHRSLSLSIQRAEEAAAAGLGPILRFSPLFVLARGFSFASAQDTALKLMECALMQAKAYSTADFAHGPRAIAGPGTAAIVFGEAPPELAAQGCEIVQAPASELNPEMAPIDEIFFGQWCALLAARARGIDPDKAPFINKVTRTL